MGDGLAIDGGSPVREALLPYGRQCVDEDDVAAVLDVLRSDWLTTGPKIDEFESAVADFVGAKEAVAVSNGTAALHAAMTAAGVGPGDEVIVPAITFAASANCVVFRGGRPVFADVDANTLLLDLNDVEVRITAKTKAIIPVDFAGQACDYDALRAIAQRHNLALVADACHALGGEYKGRSAGSLADLSALSFHPVKHITTGEGGMVTTDDAPLAARMRTFRNHGITTDHRQRQTRGAWAYEMVELGFNYRMTDIQAALGISQLRKLPEFVRRRQAIAKRYDEALAGLPGVQPLEVGQEVSHAYHLYVVQIDFSLLTADRAQVFAALRAEGIGVNVHYVPVYWHPFYRERFGYGTGECPVAEEAYERLLTLPMFPAMTDDDVQDVVRALEKVVAAYRP